MVVNDAGYVIKIEGEIVMSFVLNYISNGIWTGTFSNFPEILVNHAISSRLGGVSDQPFKSMNLAMHNGDIIEKVIDNRKLFCNAIEINYHNIVTAEQIHGDHIVYVNEEHIGKGSVSYEDAIKGTDALITNCRNVPLMLFFADCVPVIIVDPIKKAIAVSHAGWKGTVKKIAQKTILAMEKNFQTQSQDCLIGIGPSIGQCCYEVDEVVVDEFKKEFKEKTDLCIKKYRNKWKLDLWMANKLQLMEIGVKEENIDCSNVCTSCNSDLFFSYRADHGSTGRIAAIISLK